MNPEHDFQELFRETLERLITPNKKGHINRALENRTRYVTVVLENLHKPHNISAVLRTIECFGVQDFYIIESKKQYRISPHVAKGAGKWVDIFRYNQGRGEDTRQCIDDLRAKGYRICATTPGLNGLSSPPQLVEEIPIDQKMAIFFGNELYGLSETALNQADAFICLPMWGFTESYNVSVSAALIFYNLLIRLRNSTVNWKLKPEEEEALRMSWYRKIITRADTIERELLRTLTKER